MDTGALDRRLGPRVADRLGHHGELLIDGKFVAAASGKTFPVYNPATGTAIAQVAEGEAEDMAALWLRRAAPSTARLVARHPL